MLKMLRDLVLEPSIVVGGIVFLGLVLQRKSLETTVKGTLKSVIGFMVIRIGGISSQRVWNLSEGCFSTDFTYPA